MTYNKQMGEESERVKEKNRLTVLDHVYCPSIANISEEKWLSTTRLLAESQEHVVLRKKRSVKEM